MSQRIFTVAEANRLLPTLERVLTGLRELRARMERESERLQILDALWGEAVRLPDNPDHDEYLRRRRRIRGLVSELEGSIQKEITGRGIRFPVGALEHGLLDFPTSYQGRWVFLCWQMGEPEILAWHEVHAGFRGRRELTEEEARHMGADDGDDPHPSDLASF